MKNQTSDLSSDEALSGAGRLASIHAKHDGNVSDKWEAYLAVYDDLLSPVRSERISLLEIGVQNGGSLEVWRRFFENAELIVGCDIDPRCGALQFNNDRISVVVGDATSPETRRKITELHEAFDIIIDDGSHTAPDIIKTFASYFPLLRNGGVFIVEDLHSSYWEEFGGGLHKPDAPMGFFKRLLDIINSEHWGNGEKPASLMRSFEEDLGFAIDDHVLASINSVQFTNSLCVIKKAEPDRNKLGLRSVVGQHATVNADIVGLAGTHIPQPDERGNTWSQTSADPFRLREDNAELSADLAQSRAQLKALSQRHDRDTDRLTDLEATLHERNAQLVRINANWALAAAEVDGLSNRLRLAESEASQGRESVAALYNSTSWRLTAPVRVAKRLLARAGRTVTPPRYMVGSAVRYLWAKFPFSAASKLRLKDAIFSTLPWVFRGSRTFDNWQLHRDSTRRLWTEASRRLLTVTDDSSPAYVPLLPVTPPDEVPVRVICFYLPQFHSIPENDAWWGEGFTEWTNVRKAETQFEGHYQPRVPGELGYYNLLDARTQRRQIEMAKLYGVSGFCFYFYWFNGRRVLEKPVENYLADSTLDLPFCLCWANENWSRRWDGLDSEILIAQEHSADDDLAFIREISIYLKDDRYIRIDGRPLLVIYRPQLLPSALETSARWRQWCRANGIGEIYLAYTQSFDAVDPATYGFDAAIEFPPNNSSAPLYTEDIQPLAPDFGGVVYDWRIFPLRSEAYHQPGYTLFRTVCPAWDNTARRKNKGTIFLGSTPGLYRRWLANAVSETIANFADREGRLVFVNAWNEWAEGAYLEPDARHGYAYLQATRDALEDSIRAQKRILVVTHDAHPHGAQFIILNIAKHLRDDLGFAVDAISLGGGPLLGDFAEVAKLSLIDLAADTAESVLEKLRKLRGQGAEIALVNTAVAGTIVPILKEAGFQVVSLIHEMPSVLESYKLQNQALMIAQHSDSVVFPAKIVRDGFESFIGQPIDNAKIRPQGVYLRNRTASIKQRAIMRNEVISELDLAFDAKIVLSVGYADHRKGLDLFVDAVAAATDQDPNVVGVWLGHADEGLLSSQLNRIRSRNIVDRFRFPGRVTNPTRYYVAADVFALTSREDPFPSVVMEALDAGLAVVAFRGAGGFEELLSRGCGVVVNAYDTAAMSAEIVNLLGDRDSARRLAQTGQAIIDREFSYRHYVFDLLDFAGSPQPKISVIVPNYNYARFIKERLRTVIDQTVPIFELIVLDDASDDGSQEAIEDALASVSIPQIFIRNNKNSGSVFHQWLRGVQEATGDLVWIAEADDLSDPQFLECVVRAFKSPETVMSFCQSRQMNADGTIIADDYLDYVSDIDSSKWTSSYHVEGQEEIAQALFLKNTIPNVSAVLFKRDALLDALSAHDAEILSYRNVGDWVTYLYILGRGGKIAFYPGSLNGHRRHQHGVTLSGFDVRHLHEILRVQRAVIQRFALGDKASAAADAYAQHLYQQFGLASDQYPLFSDHPALQELDVADIASGEGGQTV